MSATVEVDVDRILETALARFNELQERQAVLALDALTDPKAAKELATVEADLAVAEQTLRRTELAQGERARRERQAAIDAAEAGRAAALQRARELQAERVKLAKSIDRKLADLAADLAAYNTAAGGQAYALRSAGVLGMEQAMGAQAKPWMLAGAITYACFKANVPPSFLPFKALAGSIRPLAEANPRFVDPAGEA